MKRLFLPVLVLLFLISGCATKYKVRIDGLSEMDGTMVAGKSYALASKTPGVQVTDLFFKEVEVQRCT